MNYTFRMEENEYWWGGTAVDGTNSPYDKNTSVEFDFMYDCPNQTMPMYLSSKGRCIWSENGFRVTVKNGEFLIEGEDVTIEVFGSTLRDAYLGAMKKHFPPRGNLLQRDFFKTPQYNTWMQFTYEPTQEKVLKYARDIISNGFPPGILIIDEGWSSFYGTWKFNPLTFPSPKEMITQLHEMGFRVMLWVVPSVRPDGRDYIGQTMQEFNPENYDKMFLRNTKGEVLLSNWWNGVSAMLDLTKQCDCDFLDKQLKALMNEYGVDGFKFDGGTVERYSDRSAINGPVDKSHTPHERNIAWNDFGARYAFHEYKDTFKGGGKRVIQRIRDRSHSWDNNGINTLLPMALLQGLLGHAFICPDMIGGGEWTQRELNLPVDEELFIRMAQCSALFPMMQFSWAPWEAVSEKSLEIIKAAALLHTKLGETIVSLAEKAEQDGEPIMRHMEYSYPHCGYEKITDQYMLGESILAAPVTVKGAFSRDVVFPEGSWRDETGKIYEGGKTVSVPSPIDKILYFIKC